MEEALSARLLADVAMAALVRTTVHWLERPAGSALPGVTLQLLSAGRSYDHDGAAGLSGPRVRVDCWGASYGSAKLVARAVIAAIEPPAVSGGIAFSNSFLIGERDLGPEDIPGGGKAFRVSMDFYVWWKRSQGA